MGLGDHVNLQLKRGVKILTCDPALRLIEAETRNGEVITVNAYYYSPAFRWPVAGEKWMVTEENGSWFLTGIYEQQAAENVQALPGDIILSAPTGRLLLNVEGILTEFSEFDSFPRPARPTITGTTIYVSAMGSDSNDGRGERTPYQTIAKALEQDLRPGDGVLMRGGDTFAEGFTPTLSGESGSPIVFGSYGHGNAKIMGQIVTFPGPNWLTFDHLTVTATGAGFSSLAGWGNHIRIQNCNLSSELATAITVASGLRKRSGLSESVNEDYLTPPIGWEIISNVIHETGDSGILIGAAIEQAQHGSAEEIEGRRTAEYPGEGMVIEGNVISRTGLNTGLTYGKHGIYLKAKNSTVKRNLITDFEANGVSQRYSNCVIEDNQISNGPVALAFFQYGNASTLGESQWIHNAISNVDAAFYAPSAEPSWTDGVATSIPTEEAFILSENQVTGATEGNNLNSTKVYDDGSNAYLGPHSFRAIASPVETVAGLKKTIDELREVLNRVGIMP